MSYGVGWTHSYVADPSANNTTHSARDDIIDFTLGVGLMKNKVLMPSARHGVAH